MCRRPHWAGLWATPEAHCHTHHLPSHGAGFESALFGRPPARNCGGESHRPVSNVFSPAGSAYRQRGCSNQDSGGGVRIPGSRHAGASSQGVPETAAEDYLELILTNEWQERGLEKALLQGNFLLEATGGVPEAALVLRAVGRVRLSGHVAELGDPRLDEALDADLLAYARTLANRGIRACYEGDRGARVTAEPHASAREHLPEAISQLWKDARRGRVILCDDLTGDLLSGVLSVPLARVPKMNPDSIGRRSDGLGPARPQRRNEGTDPAAHPPALQPRHREVIRMILWWTLRLPGVPILLAKKGVAEAFEWVWIDADDVPPFGADIPGDGFGLSGRRITAIYLCVTFGFTGPMDGVGLADEALSF